MGAHGPSRAPRAAGRPTRPRVRAAGSGSGSSVGVLLRSSGPRDCGLTTLTDRRLPDSTPDADTFLDGSCPTHQDGGHGHPRESRTARPHRGPGGRLPPRHGLLRPRARPRRRLAAGRLRHQRAPRHLAEHLLQRGAHRRHHAGDLRLPHGAGLRRAALHRPRHPRPLRAGVGHRARGARRQRRHRAGRRPRRLHPDPRGQPRDHPRQPGAYDGRGPRRRHRGHARRTTRRRTAASSTTRPTAGRPTPTRRASSPPAPTS